MKVNKRNLLICIILYVVINALFVYIYIYSFNSFILLFSDLLLGGVLCLTYRKYKFKFFSLILLCFAILKLILLLFPSLFYKIQPYLC